MTCDTTPTPSIFQKSANSGTHIMTEPTTPHVVESFLELDECRQVIQIIQSNARREPGCQPKVCTEKRTIVHAKSLYALGFHTQAMQLARIRDRCCQEISKYWTQKSRIYPEYTVLQGNYSGDGHVRHADNCRRDEVSGRWVPNHTPHRIISCGIYLNQYGEDFTGGELVFPSGGWEFHPAPGLLIAFPSNERFEHAVPTVTSGARYSIFIWFTPDPDRAESPLFPENAAQRHPPT